MPRGPKGEKRPADAMGNALMIARIATGEINETESLPDYGSVSVRDFVVIDQRQAAIALIANTAISGKHSSVKKIEERSGHSEYGISQKIKIFISRSLIPLPCEAYR
jgi:hypothetical protein